MPCVCSCWDNQILGGNADQSSPHQTEQSFKWGHLSRTRIWRWSTFICLPSNTSEKNPKNIHQLLHFNTLKCSWRGAIARNSYLLHQWLERLLRDTWQTMCTILWVQGLPQRNAYPQVVELSFGRETGGKKAGCWSGQQVQQTHLDTCCPPEGKVLASSWLRNTVRGKTKINDITLQGIRQHNKNKRYCSEETKKTSGLKKSYEITFSCSVQRWALLDLWGPKYLGKTLLKSIYLRLK